MLSFRSILNIVVGLALLAVFTFGTTELRLAVAGPSYWLLGLFIYQRFRASLPACFLRAHALLVVVTFVLLAVTNDIFYFNVVGRFLDLFFERDRYDPDAPGSGAVDFIETFFRRHGDDIRFFFRFLWFAVKTLVGFGSLPVIVTFAHFWAHYEDSSTRYERIFRWQMENDGVFPPWLHPSPEPAPPEPKRDTRYCRLGDGDVIYVCGRGGGFERVIDGDIEGAISRQRRLLSKEFA